MTNNEILEKHTFGSYLRFIREEEYKILSIDMAHMLKTQIHKVSDFEHGRRVVTLKKAIEIADLLGKDPEIFIILALKDQLVKKSDEISKLLGKNIEMSIKLSLKNQAIEKSNSSMVSMEMLEDILE